MFNVKLLALPLLLCALSISTSHADLIMHLSGDGNALDSSGNGHHGTLVNGTTFGAGQVGLAFSFDGVNDYLTVDAAPELEPGLISVAMWVKTGSSSGLKLLADSSHGHTNGNQGWAVQLDSSGSPSFAYGNGSAFPQVTAGVDIADNQFHHVVATYDGLDLKLYIDGTLDNTVAYTGTPVGTGEEIRLGRHFSLNRQFGGFIDDFRLYNHALSQAEINNLLAIPEPTSLALFGMIGIVLLGYRKRA